MKTVGTILFLSLLPLLATSQIKFSVEADGLENDYILVEKPLNGRYFPTSPDKIIQDKKGKFLIETQDETPGFMKIDFGHGRTVRVFLEPGRTNSLSVDLGNFPKSLKFDGPTESQNKFLNDLHRTNLSVAGADLVNLRSGGEDEKKPKDYYLEVLDNIDAEKKILLKKGKKKFSGAFIAAMEQDIVYYYTALFSEMVAKDYREFASGAPSRFNSKWAYYWSKIFEIQPIGRETNALSEYYVKALDYYLSDYRLGYQGDAIYEDPDLVIGEQFLEYDRLLWNEFKGPDLEYALSAVLSHRALMGKNESVLFDLFLKYQNDFPNSIYLKPFEKAVAPIGESLKEAVFSFPEGMIQLDATEEIHTIEDIMKRFPGKVVYMDVWATWCSPCLFEFRQKQPLDEFIQGKEIVLLFVSVDDDDRRDKWQKTILDNNLKGYHLLANYSLRDELINKFGDGSNLALPHYIIYDKNGNLADGNAKQPSHHSMLFKDLMRYVD